MEVDEILVSSANVDVSIGTLLYPYKVLLQLVSMHLTCPFDMILPRVCDNVDVSSLMWFAHPRDEEPALYGPLGWTYPSAGR